MNKAKIFKTFKTTIYLILVLSFLIIYFTSEAGYFDHIKSRRVSLTTEQIAKFEQDIKEGKEIDINDYYINKDDEYNNKFSKLGLTLSNKLREIIIAVLNKTFKILNDFLNG